jgi:hypothetical protein
MISNMLLQHTPTSLSSHLSSLLNYWISQGGYPHSFGAMWLQAPSALLRFKNVTQFESHLAQLAQLVPEISPSDLLASSASLAGMLLSLRDVTGELEGHIHHVGGYTGFDGESRPPLVIVFSHPSLRNVSCVHYPQQQWLNGCDPTIVSVYGVVQQQPGPGADSSIRIRSSRSCSSSSELPLAPWQQQAEHKHIGGVYEQPVEASVTRSSSILIGDTIINADGSMNIGGDGDERVQLLAEIEVYPSSSSSSSSGEGPYGSSSSRQDRPPVPVLVLPSQGTARLTVGGGPWRF